MNGGAAQRTWQVADVAGAFGAIVAALCCAGTPVIVAALTALGLGFLKRDSILWPVMLASLAVALWGLWTARRIHRRAGPLLLGIAGASTLASGVIVVHGRSAMLYIYVGAAALVAATLWNIGARRAAARSG